MPAADIPPSDRLHPGTTLGPVRLHAADAEGLADWYVRVLGLVLLAADDRGAVLGTPGGEPLLALLARPGAERPARDEPGLYHTAFLLPTRADLGRFLRHVSMAGIRLSGAADHLVSEAVYLTDPEGNGVEVYRDRPRSEWQWTEAGVRMDNAPLDVRAILAEAEVAGEQFSTAPDGTTIGHVHLKVADLDATERFYAQVLGFDVMERFPGALFVSAGGYHHHLGLNAWESLGGIRRPGRTGLAELVLHIPQDGRAAVLDRLAASGITTEQTGDVFAVTDPAGNRLALEPENPDPSRLLEPV